MENKLDTLLTALDQLNIPIHAKMEEQLLKYYDLLVNWNKVMNLTSITEFDEVVKKHFLDSLVLGHYLNLDQSLSMIDVGTGAGFPGIPLKIVFPELKVLLVDSLLKRIHFLNEVVQDLKLSDISAVHGRVEELGHSEKYREHFDLCVSRAVANLSSLCEYCLPFVKVGGVFISYKTDSVDSEFENAKKAIHVLGGKPNKIEKFILPNTDYHRSLVFIDKIEKTVKKYPRKPGIPSKKPL